MDLTNALKLEDLKERSAKLVLINECSATFIKARDRAGSQSWVQIATYFEEYETRVFKKSIGFIVPKESASLLSVAPLSIAANHSSMCKFQHERVNGYVSVSDTLCKWIREIQTTDTSDGSEPKV